jgi:hypothetical protein
MEINMCCPHSDLGECMQCTQARIITSPVEQPTLRDQFAMAALTGLISRWSDSYSPTAMSEFAYQIADAMTKVREISDD